VRRLLESARDGQKADERRESAETALRRNDPALALREAEAARALAPWDGRLSDLLERIRSAQRAEAEARAQREAQEAARAAAASQQQKQQTAVNGLLAQADAALSAQNYDAAIELYDEAIKLDGQNQRAVQGRTGAIAARAIATAGARTPRKAFVAGKTTAQSAETRATGNQPPGFENSPGVNVRSATQAAELPGKILFEVSPEAVKGGDRYVVRIYFLNEGKAPIGIRDMVIASKVNGRGNQGAVAPLAREVAPQQKALLRELPDLWKEDTSSWTMEVIVQTNRSETYRNQVTWK
jgi:tetratricopeptide (TPR) repeat protein